MNNKINRESLLLAIKRDELKAFLRGKGVYSFGSNPYAPGNSMLNLSCAMPEIYSYYNENQNSAIDSLLEKTLLEWLTWKSGIGVYAVFSVMSYHLIKESQNKAPFKLNNTKILDELKKAATMYEDKLKLNQEYEGEGLNEGLWEAMQKENERNKKEYGINIL